VPENSARLMQEEVQMENDVKVSHPIENFELVSTTV